MSQKPEMPLPEILAAIEQHYERLGQESTPLPGEMRWTANWLSSELQMLPLDARGLYGEMLTQAWVTRARMKRTSEDEIMRLVRATPEEWARAWPRIRHYWQEATDPRTGQTVLVNVQQLRIYLESLRGRVEIILKNRHAAAVSVATRKAMAKVTPRREAPAKPATPAPAPVPPPSTAAAPRQSPRDVPPCPDCVEVPLQRRSATSSPTGMRYPPNWFCSGHKGGIPLNDPRVYKHLTPAAQASIDHELREHERAIAAATPAAEPPTPRAARAARTPPPAAGPDVLEKARPF